MLRRIILLIGLLVMLLPAAAVLAGGWVVIILDTMPEQIQAGESLELSFMVRQHGKTPTHDVSPILTATNTKTGQQIQADAQPASKVGRFMVALNFPEAGAWEWSISAEPFQQTTTFAPLTVLAAQTVAGPEQSDQAITGLPAPKQMAAPEQTVGLEQIDQPGSGLRAPLRWAGLALLGAAAILAVLGRRRGREIIAQASGD